MATLSRASRQTVHDDDDDDAGAQTRSRRPGLTHLTATDNTNQDTTVCLSVSDVLPCRRVSERTQRCDLAQSDERLRLSALSAGSRHQTTAAAAAAAATRARRLGAGLE